MSHFLFYSLLPIVVAIGVTMMLVLFLKNRLALLRRTYTVKGENGARVDFVVNEDDDFEEELRLALIRLESEEPRGRAAVQG